MTIDSRILMINDDRREKLDKLTGLFRTINGMYDDITTTYEEMRDVYDTLIENENEMVKLEQENYDDAKREHLDRIIINATKNGCITLDAIISAVRNNAPEHLKSVAGRHVIAIAVSDLAKRGKLISVIRSDTVYGIPDKGNNRDVL